MNVAAWIANGLVLVGWWAMGRQRRWAPLCTAAGSLLWCWIGLTLAMPAMAFIEAASVSLQLRAWWKWRTDRGRPES